MGTEIKLRLINLGKKQVDLLEELYKRGFKSIDKSFLSEVINENIKSPKAQIFLSRIDEIIKEWEQDH